MIFFIKIILVIALLLYLLKTLWVLYIYVKNYAIVHKLPGPPRCGIIMGNLTSLGEDLDVVFQRTVQFSRDFYPACKFYAMHRIFVFILSPEDCELVLSNPIHNEKGYIYNALHKWLKFGLLTSSGTKWQNRRKILTQAFHFNILQQFISVFNEQSEKLVEMLKAECTRTAVEVNPLIAQFTLKTISEAAMGTKLEYKSKAERDYKNAVYDVGKILCYRIMHPWCMTDIGNLLSPFFFKEIKAVNTLHEFTKEVIKEREQNFTDVELTEEYHDVYKGKKRLAMLDLLLSAKKNEDIIDDKGIQEEVDTFMFEGHDTITVALSFMVMLLANYKNVQERIYFEMVEVLEDLSKKPTYKDLQNLKYMERCIKESLRLYPSVYFISRILGEDMTITGGYLLPKNTEVGVHIYSIHHNPNIYPDPERFDPDRFLPENCQNRHPYAYLPFSAGPRNCIGQKFAMLEMKVAVSAILASFTLEPIDTQETIEPVADLVIRTKQGIKVKFVPRT